MDVTLGSTRDLRTLLHDAEARRVLRQCEEVCQATGAACLALAMDPALGGEQHVLTECWHLLLAATTVLGKIDDHGVQTVIAVLGACERVTAEVAARLDPPSSSGRLGAFSSLCDDCSRSCQRAVRLVWDS
jgi:hypothetical protein